MKPVRHITNPLNNELETRLRERYAQFPRQAAEPEPMEGEPVMPTAPPAVSEPGMGVSSENIALEQLHPLYESLLQAHRKVRNLSGELTKRRLTDVQLKDFGMAEDWLSVTKGIARQYGEALIQLEQLLEQLNEGVADFRTKFGKDPDFLSGE